MTRFRFIRLVPLAAAIAAAIVLAACSTAPSASATPGSAAANHSVGTPDAMAKMDVQMKAMQAVHEKMMTAKTPDERSKLMADHMKTMQDAMAMMDGMSGTGMGDMKAMQDMGGDMGKRHQMMEKRMEMMQGMMKMMMDRMPAASVK
jgi:hypothetical protein